MSLLRSREQAIQRGIKQEALIRRIGRRVHKRFRSWSQQRTRKFWLPENVSLHSPVELMDEWILAAAVQKAATIRKHDLNLWYNEQRLSLNVYRFGFAKRYTELATTLSGQQLGYIYYGFGKSRFLYEPLYNDMMKYTETMLPKLNSHGLMCVVWTLGRLQIRNETFLSKYSAEVAARFDDIRVTDLIKICNSLAKLDICVAILKEKISNNMINKLETIYAQDFRNAINTVAMVHLYDDKTQAYIFSRFSKIFICARPQHLQQAYVSAVAARVLLQNVWTQLDKSVKAYFTRLSMRNIQQTLRRPSRFQWDVSNCLAKMGISHRNTFYWGCYWIDIGEVNDKSNCWFIDGPCCFYTYSTQYTNKVKLQHRILENLGWNIRRVPWFKWALMLNKPQEKINYLRKLRESGSQGEYLSDVEILSSSEIRNRLRMVKEYYKENESN